MNEMGERILRKHMGIIRPDFYAGRGPCASDLSDWKLYGIYKDLNELNREFGENFIRFVDSIPSIGATEFIKAFEKFSKDGYIYIPTEIETKLQIDGRTDKEKILLLRNIFIN